MGSPGDKIVLDHIELSGEKREPSEMRSTNLPEHGQVWEPTRSQRLTCYSTSQYTPGAKCATLRGIPNTKWASPSCVLLLVTPIALLAIPASIIIS